MSELEDNSSTPEPAAENDPASGSSPRQSLRVVATALVCLGVFALGTYGVKAITSGATVIVEADEIATVLMKTGGIRLEEIDGPLVITLRPGRNAVRAGKFHVVAEIEGVQLNFSTGRTLQINKDDELTMRIESVPDDS